MEGLWVDNFGGSVLLLEIDYVVVGAYWVHHSGGVALLIA